MFGNNMIHSGRTFLTFVCVMPLIANGGPIVEKDNFAIERPGSSSAFRVESRVYASRGAAIDDFLFEVKIPAVGSQEPPFFVGDRVGWNLHQGRWRLTVKAGRTVFTVSGFDFEPPLKNIELLAVALCSILDTSKRDRADAPANNASDPVGMAPAQRALRPKVFDGWTFRR